MCSPSCGEWRIPRTDGPKDLGLDLRAVPLASWLSPRASRPSNLSLSELSTEAGVAGGPKESPATAFVICTNGREGEKKSGSQLLSDERLDDRGISQW
jgi:hypothetical protein